MSATTAAALAVRPGRLARVRGWHRRYGMPALGGLIVVAWLLHIMI